MGQSGWQDLSPADAMADPAFSQSIAQLHLEFFPTIAYCREALGPDKVVPEARTSFANKPELLRQKRGFLRDLLQIKVSAPLPADDIWSRGGLPLAFALRSC